MNVSTHTVSPEEAERKLEQYTGLKPSQLTEEDELLIKAYRAALRGKRLVDVAAAFRQTGLSEQGEPKLAIAGASWPSVFLVMRWASARFQKSRVLRPNSKQFVDIPSRAVVPEGRLLPSGLWSPVPHVPASLRPRARLENFHILFEVEAWQTYPVDPFLLRHLIGMLYVIEAEWDLTPLEASLLSATRAL